MTQTDWARIHKFEKVQWNSFEVLKEQYGEFDPWLAGWLTSVLALANNFN